MCPVIHWVFLMPKKEFKVSEGWELLQTEIYNFLSEKKVSKVTCLMVSYDLIWGPIVKINYEVGSRSSLRVLILHDFSEESLRQQVETLACSLDIKIYATTSLILGVGGAFTCIIYASKGL